jgi:hypothetical protein
MRCKSLFRKKRKTGLVHIAIIRFFFHLVSVFVSMGILKNGKEVIMAITTTTSSNSSNNEKQQKRKREKHFLRNKPHMQ